jgi:transposase-like protein
MEDSPIALEKWMPAMWLVASNRNGISSWELHRALGVTQKTAWFMLHRIRLAMQDESKGGKLGGPDGPVVEMDETWIGGKARNMHPSRKARMKQEKHFGKSIVHGILERGGTVRAKVVDDTQFMTLIDRIRENIEPGSPLHTDESVSYIGLDCEFEHEVVNHLETYVRGNVHTNGMENFWSLLKRTLGGTYVSVEPFHLFRYVDEQAFRYNNRKPMSDADRFGYLVRKVVGKRLTYDELTGKEEETQEQAL